MATIPTQAQIDAGQDARLDKLEGVLPTPPPPAPPPGEAPVPAPVLPTVITAPGFGAGPFTIGKTITRVIGTYKDGVPIAGKRYRNGVPIAGATAAAYTIMTEDLGQQLHYEELVEGPMKVQRSFRSATVVPAPAPPVAPSAGIESAIKDMSLSNDFILKGYESFKTGWYLKSENGMGATPTFNEASTATWSQMYHHPNYWGKTCRAMLPWCVIFDGTGDQSKNTGVELVDIYGYVLTKARKWIQLCHQPTMGGQNYGKPNTGLPGRNPVTHNDGRIIELPTDRRLFWHGWGNLAAFDPNDLLATFVKVKARLVVIPGQSDDRHLAELGLQVGNDFYLDTGYRYNDVGYAPNTFIARTRKITNEWQTFTGCNLKDVHGQNPGNTGITQAELRATPPPL